KDLGYDGIEFNTPLDLDISDILKACQATDLRVPSVVNKDHWSKPLSDPDAAVRKHTIDSVALSRQEVKVLGGDTVLVVPGVVNDKVAYQTAYKIALGSIRQLIPHFEKSSVKIALENAWCNFI